MRAFYSAFIPYSVRVEPTAKLPASGSNVMLEIAAVEKN
jgi:hypothetical protein